MSFLRHVSAFTLLAILSLSSSQLSAQNLLTNASFESVLEYGDPTLPNWFAFFGAGSDGTFSTIDGGYTGNVNASDGANNLSISNNGTPDGFSGVFQRVGGATAGLEYLFEFEALSNGSAAFPIGAEFRIEFLDIAGGVIGSTGNVAIAGDLTDTYQSFSLAAVAPAGTEFINPVIAIETFSANGTPGNLFVDNASLSVVPEPSSVALLGLGSLALLKRRRS